MRTGTKAIYGLFGDREAAKRAVAALRAEDHGELLVMSGEPLEETGPGWKAQKTKMPWVALAGGVIGGVSGYGLAWYTQVAYPLPTGGMPMVAWWPTGVVIYEFSMLGAIVATLITFLASAGLPHWRKRVYDPEVTNGKILVGIGEPEPGSVAEIERRLVQAGAEQVKGWPGGGA